MTHFLCRDCFHRLIIYGKAPYSFREEPIPEIQKVYSLFQFNGVFKTLIHHSKYRNMRYIGSFLGRKMGTYFRHLDFSEYDAILPIPLHSVKLRERGYNQSYEIAQGLSKELAIECNSKILKRITYTQTQTSLSKEERSKNMENVFSYSPGKKDINAVILIDDVFTTGATVTAAARCLRQQGVHKITVLTAGTPFYLKHCSYSLKMDDVSLPEKD